MSPNRKPYIPKVLDPFFVNYNMFFHELSKSSTVKNRLNTGHLLPILVEQVHFVKWLHSFFIVKSCQEIDHWNVVNVVAAAAYELVSIRSKLCYLVTIFLNSD